MLEIDCPSCEGTGEFNNGFDAYSVCWHCDGTGTIESEMEEDDE